MKIICPEPVGIPHNISAHFTIEMQKSGNEFIQYSSRPQNETELIQRIENAHIILISNLPLSSKVLKRAQNLKMISVAFTGIDHIDIQYCKENNISVSNTAGYSTQAVSELALGLMLDVLRKISETQIWLQNKSDRKGFLGTELNGKTIGILGTGAIGTRMAKLLQAFGCKVIAWSKSEKKELLNIGIQYLSLNKVIEESDILSLHLPLNSETEHLISKERIAQMKQGAFLINTARGKIVDNTALADALKNGHLAGAGIDVFETEPPLLKNHPLLNAPNCVCVPHIGYATHEALTIRSEIALENIRKWTKGIPQNIIV